MTPRFGQVVVRRGVFGRRAARRGQEDMGWDDLPWRKRLHLPEYAADGAF